MPFATVSISYTTWIGQAPGLPGVPEGGEGEGEAGQLPIYPGRPGRPIAPPPPDVEAIRERIAEIKAEVREKLDAIKAEIADRIPGMRDKLDALREELRDKLEELKDKWHAERPGHLPGGIDIAGIVAKIVEIKEVLGRKWEEIKAEIIARIPEMKEKLEAAKEALKAKIDEIREILAGHVPTQPLPGAPSREEIKAAVKAKIEEWVAGLNPPSREEVKAKLDQLANAIRDKLAERLPEGCVKQPK